MLGKQVTWLRARANPAKRAAAAMPAAVPSRLTAPSVPLGTTFNVVMRYAVLPYAYAGKLPMFSSRKVHVMRAQGTHRKHALL